MFIRINASVHHPTKQIIEDVGQALGVQHAMESAHEHGVVWLESLRGTTNIV